MANRKRKKEIATRTKNTTAKPHKYQIQGSEGVEVMALVTFLLLWPCDQNNLRKNFFWLRVPERQSPLLGVGGEQQRCGVKVQGKDRGREEKKPEVE